jgi:hypothetical protein
MASRLSLSFDFPDMGALPVAAPGLATAGVAAAAAAAGTPLVASPRTSGSWNMQWSTKEVVFKHPLGQCSRSSYDCWLAAMHSGRKALRNPKPRDIVNLLSYEGALEPMSRFHGGGPIAVYMNLAYY